MKLLVIVFLGLSSAFYNSNVILHKRTNPASSGYLTNTNYYNNKHFNTNVSRKRHYYNKNGGSENKDEEDKDIIKILGELMGYPAEQKWKGTRFLVYSLIAGYLLGDAIEQLRVFIANT